jgi:hypothetical protein
MMIEWLKSWIRPQPVGQVVRSSRWASVRKEYLQRWNWCAACGRKNFLEVHHIIPVSQDKAQELVVDNLITLCRPTCHLLIGHLNDWSSWNPEVKSDSDHLLRRIRSRPR